MHPELRKIIDAAFGGDDPKKMPPHFFSGARFIDYRTARRANTQKQNCSVAPRHWYIDADYECTTCRREFTWTADEQRVWFEVYRFWIDVHPRLCPECCAKRRHLSGLRKEYDRAVAAARSHGTVEEKLRVIQIVTELQAASAGIPDRMRETKELFERQAKRANTKEEGDGSLEKDLTGEPHP